MLEGWSKAQKTRTWA